MKINIGSKNIVKVNAVKESIRDYSFLKKAKINFLDADSGVSPQPKSMNETINGAINRAKKCFKDCDLSFGIEDGLIKVPKTKTGFMNITVCAIYDGKKIHLGLSSGFEYPIKVTKLVFEKGMDISQAMNKVGLTNDKDIGSTCGAIGILTKGRQWRKEYTKQAIINALIPLDNKELY